MAWDEAPASRAMPFADQVLHALGDVGLLEEGRAISLRGDQLVELLDLVAELDRQRIRLQLAGISDCLHRIKLHQGAINFQLSAVTKVLTCL